MIYNDLGAKILLIYWAKGAVFYFSMALRGLSAGGAVNRG